jgi:hypothetical protein
MIKKRDFLMRIMGDDFSKEYMKDRERKKKKLFIERL